MRYHYQHGASKKRSGIGRFKLAIVSLLIVFVGSYIGFLSVLPGLGGWPFKRGDEVAKRVKTTKPGSDGNIIYIPKINSSIAVASGAAELEGELGAGKEATLRADKLRLEPTPRATIERSAFFRLNQLKDGDEFFVDYKGTRFAYSISDKADATMTLQTTDNSVSVKAKAIGVVAWNDGSPRIESVN